MLSGFLGPKTREVMYIGFGLHLAEAADLARKLRDEPYAYDRDGKEEFEHDLKTLADRLDRLEKDYIANKELWAE